MKNIFIICVILLSYLVSNAQNRISGTIVDQNNEALVGATVLVPETNKGTVSDNNGVFELVNLPDGMLKIQISFVGYNTHIELVELKGESLYVNISLKPIPIETQEIVISGIYNATQHENAVKIELLKLNSLYIKNTPNFTEVLTKIPGVDMISKGSGVSKPVIRGLSMNDILVLNNGVRFENYQYSSHHPLGIDEFGIEDVEIIKGPASLLYGSDAIGGVINFIKEKPAPIGKVVGDYNLQLFSNTFGMTNNLGIKGTSKKFYAGVRVGEKTNADFLQGGGEYVPNSRFNEYSFKANAGFTDKIGYFKLFYDFNNQKLGLVEDEAIDQITERGRKNSLFFQEFYTHLFSSQNKLYLGRYKLDLNSAYQNTELTHFGDPGIYELQMKLATFTYDAKLHLPAKDNTEYILGIQGMNQVNSNINDRETLLLPDAKTNNFSGFGLLQYTFFEKLKLQTGIRYDIKSIETQPIGESDDLSNYRAAIKKSYGSFSGSLGTVYNFTDDLLMRANFAAAYRTPNLAELTSKGQHELKFEIGDPNLVPENSYESDISIHYHKENLTFEVAGFYNRVNNYIYLSPTSDKTDSGIDIYKYQQANATLYGGETGLHIHPVAIKWMHFEVNYSSVIGKQKNGEYLPFIPAHKLNFEISGEMKKLLFLKNAFVTFNTLTAFNQNNAAPDETPTKGYTLLNMSVGGNIKIENQLIYLSIAASNLLDKKYIDHLSTLKEVGLFNPGRNVSIHLKIPFGV